MKKQDNKDTRDSKLLFRWSGRHIEPYLIHSTGKIPALTAEKRKQYLNMLAETLRERSLYAKIPENDFLGNGETVKLTRPCLCFTELRLGEVGDHWRRYGRMAFGFTKTFVASEGGGSVTYINGSKEKPLVRSLELLQKHVADSGDPKLQNAIGLIWHFFKRMTASPKRAGKTKPTGVVEVRVKKKKIGSLEEEAAKAARFPRTKPLPYLDEHEWRLVYSDGSRWETKEDRSSPKEARFRFETGTELQVVVVPDNYTVQKALQCTVIAEKLFPKYGSPPVQLISLESVIRM